MTQICAPVFLHTHARLWDWSQIELVPIEDFCSGMSGHHFFTGEFRTKYTLMIQSKVLQ